MKKAMIILASAIVLGSCTGEKKEVALHSVMTVQPQAVGGQQMKQFAGQVKESADVNLGFKTAGQIVRIYVKEGQHVSKGQLLAQLDDKDYQLGVKAAQAQYNQLKSEVERITKLYEKKSISGNDYDKAKAGLEQVGVNLENNLNKVRYTRLYAPANGVVQNVNFEVMEMVNAGTPVFNILYTNGLQVETNIPASVYMQKANIKGAYCQIKGHSYAARLVSIVPKADNTQLYKATFAIEGAGPDVTAGMNADVRLDIDGGQEQQGLSLPVNAVFENDGKSYVWVVGKDSTVTKTQVSIRGAGDDGSIVINSGLNGSETIVRAGVHALQNKQKVKVITKTSDTNVGGML